ncbi:Uu.00g071510.m01.CDS01 [Anthostomella pinea]|uniref:Uu.00g071510.m01.CDS01 n=1 Tax=Anthostomella pinea TaxID=933095 RepID=A0AAI8YNW2_9PEZI|nr:Uu.00g071510.m01.CDS01 [Anthostomella pinea]
MTAFTNIIDLTLDEDDDHGKEEEEEKSVVLSGPGQVLPTPKPAPSPLSTIASAVRPPNIQSTPNAFRTPHHGETNELRHPTLQPSHHVVTPASYASASPSTPSQSTPSQYNDERPPKRQKLEDGSDPQPTPPTERVRDGLKRCLERQVFPHIDLEVQRLDKNIYDINKLGTKVVGQIVDKQFQQHYREGNGELSQAAVGAVAARARRLVVELAAGSEFRRLTTPRPTPQPSAYVLPPTVLPSIENVPHGVAHVANEAQGRDLVTTMESPKLARQLKAHTPPLLLPRPKKETVVSPQRVRARAKATLWQSGKSYESKREGSPVSAQSRWFGLPSRPYLKAEIRQQIALGAQNSRLLDIDSNELPQSEVFHVDFHDSEEGYFQYLARQLYGKTITKPGRTVRQDLRHLIKKIPAMRARIVALHGEGYKGYDPPPDCLRKRSTEDIGNFLEDLYRRRLNPVPKSLFLEGYDTVARSDVSRANRVPALLLTREIAGNRVGATRRYQNFTTAFKSNREDYLEPKVEWTNCAGDIMTMSWLSNTQFICGATTHSDSHNQQYNKPGNLLLGSATANTLRAYPDHRIVRPLVEHGDNALESMRESQDPWLYTSVVASDYDASNNLAFTSSFDRTVKIWKPDGDSMTAGGTWVHDGRVNFVLASKNQHGTIATAADVPTEAVRVYHLNGLEDVSGSRFDSYSCTRVHDEDYVPSDKWAYYPAAIRWGVAPVVSHLLLIGYSPRSPTGQDHEIPEDKRGTGELCLWDTVTRSQVKVNSAKTQNVFEVVWHPTRPSFAAATSASQTSEKIEQQIRTQIRIFELNETGQYGAIKTLDCTAIDINELTIRPNSLLYSYVAASCTDGKVYVWDSAGSDRPMCVLEHGEPVEELMGERDMEDVGVKFAAWGTSSDRLYTGSSDGVVKVWNIRHGRGVHVKDLIEVAAPITAGAFSPDFTRLAIGDGSGRVYLMALEETETEEQTRSTAVSSGFLTLQVNGRQRAVRRPRPFIPHAELPHPDDLTDSSKPRLEIGQARAREYLDHGELVRHPDATIGVVRGANYAETGLFREEAHLNGDATEPLLSGFENQQQENQKFSRTQRFSRQRTVDDEAVGKFQGLHAQNYGLNFSKYDLDLSSRVQLEKEGVELEPSLVELDYESSIDDSEDDD